jgi:hypothetical protein
MGPTLGYLKQNRIGHPTQLFFFDLNGRLLRQVELPDAISEVAQHAATWYIGCRDGRVYAHTTDGKRMWRWKWPHGPQAPTIHGVTIGAPTPPSLSVAASGLGVAVGERRLLYLLDHCGQKQWATAIPRHDLTYRRREMGEPCELPSQQDAHERLIRNGAPLNVRPAAYLRLALGQEEGLFGPAFTSMVECYGWSDERYLLRAAEGAASDLDNVKVQIGGELYGEVIATIAATDEEIAVGTSDGKVHVFDHEASLLKVTEVAWGPVSTLLVHQNEVRALYAEGLLGRWERGRVAAKVRLPDHRAELATDGEQFLVWKGKTAWLVDGDCRVVWKAEFANRVGSGLMADGRAWILAGRLRSFGPTAAGGQGGQAHERG